MVECNLAKVEVEGSNPFSRFFESPDFKNRGFFVSCRVCGQSRLDEALRVYGKGEFEQRMDRLLIKGRTGTLNDFSSVED